MKLILVPAVLVFITIGGIGFIIPFLPEFAQRVGGEEWVGLVWSAFAIARLPAVPVASVLSDRLGKRKIFIISGLLIYIITAFAYTVSNSLAHLLAVRIFHGIATSLVIPISFAWAVDIVPKGKEGFAGAFVGASLLLGFSLGPAIGGVAGELFGSNSAFYLMAGAGAVALLVALIFGKDTVKERKERSVFEELKLIVTSKTNLKAFLTWFFVIWQRAVLISYAPLLLERKGFGMAKVGGVLTAYSLLSSLFQYSASPFVDRAKARFKIAFSFALLSSLPFFLIPKISDAKVLSVLFAISGTLSALVYPFVIAEVAKEVKGTGREGGTIGFLDTAFSLGNIIGPTALGFLTTLTGVEGMFLWAGTFLSTIFLLMLIFL